MINGLEGIPGSGKSYEAAVVHVLEALRRGRKVITNLPLNIDAYCLLLPEARQLLEVRTATEPVRGVWDATKPNAFELFPDGSTKAPPEDRHMFASVWDYYSPWRHPVEGFGPLFVIDECHVALGKDNAGQIKEVVQWFKLSRHFNADVLLMTQSFRDVNDSIRTLIAMLIKVRKADIIDREGYIRKVHGGYRGAVISDEIRQYDPAKFVLYRSHTQGGAVQEFKATDVVSGARKWRKRARWFMVGGVVMFVATIGSMFMGDDKPKKTAKRPTMNAQAAELPKPLPTFEAQPATQAQPEEDQSVAQGKDPEPYGGYGLHLTGHMQMKGRAVYTFTVSQNGVVQHAITDSQLVAAGYKWRPLADCAGVLEWQVKRRSVTCNSPQVAVPMGSKATSG